VRKSPISEFNAFALNRGGARTPSVIHRSQPLFVRPVLFNCADLSAHSVVRSWPVGAASTCLLRRSRVQSRELRGGRRPVTFNERRPARRFHWGRLTSRSDRAAVQLGVKFVSRPHSGTRGSPDRVSASVVALCWPQAARSRARPRVRSVNALRRNSAPCPAVQQLRNT